MADQDVTELTEDTSPTTDDLLYGVDDPSGTPADRKWTIDNLRILLEASKPKAKMTRDAAQSIPDNASTLIQFDNTDFATGITATTGAAARFVITEAGKYLVGAFCRIPGIDDVERLTITIQVNGGAGGVVSGQIYSSGSNLTLGYPVIDAYDLSVSDYVEMYVAQTSGDAQNTSTDAWGKVRMFIVKI